MKDLYVKEYDNYTKVNNYGEVSDGYHSFDELYEFRKVYNACLFNEWAKGDLVQVYKSMKHYDGEECFGGGWFIVIAETPFGQISNHYEMKDWELFDIPWAETPFEPFDGHTPSDVIERLVKTTEFYKGIR